MVIVNISLDGALTLDPAISSYRSIERLVPTVLQGYK